VERMERLYAIKSTLAYLMDRLPANQSLLRVVESTRYPSLYDEYVLEVYHRDSIDRFETWCRNSVEAISAKGIEV
jgi:hypothetical protein